MLTLLALFSLKSFAIGTLTVFHVLICVLLITVVLLQQRGRGADLASAFGAGPSQANVAALSSEDLVTKATKYGAFAFMATSLVLALFPPGQKTLAIDTVAPPAVEAPAGTETPATETPAATESVVPETTPMESVAPPESAPPTEQPPTPPGSTPGP